MFWTRILGCFIWSLACILFFVVFVWDYWDREKSEKEKVRCDFAQLLLPKVPSALPAQLHIATIVLFFRLHRARSLFLSQSRSSQCPHGSKLLLVVTLVFHFFSSFKSIIVSVSLVVLSDQLVVLSTRVFDCSPRGLVAIAWRSRSSSRRFRPGSVTYVMFV